MDSKTVSSFCSVIFIVVLAIDCSSAIFCFECNSANYMEGDLCADGFDEQKAIAANLSKDCNAEYGKSRPGVNFTYCHKLAQDVEGEYRVVRSCGTAGRTDKCVDRTGTTKIKLKYCDCDFDNCNSASNLSLNVVTVFAVVVATLLLVKVRARCTADAY